MLNTYQNQFYENWLSKADSYKEENLSNYFDNFFSLYVIFNTLYMEIMTMLVKEGQYLPSNFKDKKAATDYVIKYLGSQFFLEKLLENSQDISDLNEICEKINNEKFHIILEWGNHQKTKDEILLNSLRSNNKDKKATAILQLFYYVRCNIFHGHKNYENVQIELLSPLNRLLRKTVVLTFEKLNSRKIM